MAFAYFFIRFTLFYTFRLYLSRKMCYTEKKGKEFLHSMLLPPLTAPLLSWYRTAGRALPWREARTPYHVWISEIMLQQTRIEAVIPYYHRFLAAFPTVASLAEADEERLLKLWEGLGYYSRARNLKRAAEAIVRDHGGELPRDPEALRRLPGIGDYTAGAIASIAYGLPVPAVDGNVMRVVARVTADGRDVLSPAFRKEATAALAALYPTAPEAATAMTEALMELGETVCIPNGAPHCDACPLASLCRAREEGKETELPYRAKRTARTVEKRTVLLLLTGGRVGIFRRPPEGLLAGLWELPSADGALPESEVRELLAGWGLTPTAIRRGPEAKHIFTHREWHMTSYLIDLAGEGGGLTFVNREELRTTFAIPTAFRTYLTLLDKEL